MKLAVASAVEGDTVGNAGYADAVSPGYRRFSGLRANLVGLAGGKPAARQTCVGR